MARIRSVHPGQESDEDFVALSMAARVFCLLLRLHADDQGVFEWKPKTLKMKIFPADNVDVEAMLNELVENNHVQKFEDGGKPYGLIRNFRKYQRPKKPNALYPLPDQFRTYVGLTGDDSELVENQDGTDMENPPQMEDGEKDEGDKGKERAAKAALNADFETWYAAYPRHEAKEHARKSYLKARQTTDAATLLSGARRYAALPGREAKFTKLPATWLNGGCWEDETPQASPQKPKITPLGVGG